jgi:hypothetical protein
MSRNIFDLNQILGDIDQSHNKEETRLETKTRDASPQPNQSLLQNYEEIPRNEWARIPEKTYIRYTDLQGNIKKGCTINSLSEYGENIVFQVYAKGPNGKYTNWHTSSKNMGKIYKYVKKDQQVPQLAEAPTKKQTKKEQNTLYPPPQENSLKSSSEIPKIEPIRAEAPKIIDSFSSGLHDIPPSNINNMLIDQMQSPSTMQVDIMNKKIENLEIAFQKLHTRVNSMVRVINAICEKLPRNGGADKQPH